MVNPLLLTLGRIQSRNIKRFHRRERSHRLLRERRDLVIQVLPQLAEPVDVITDIQHLPQLRILNDLVLRQDHLLHLGATLLLPTFAELLVGPLDDRFAGTVEGVLQGVDINLPSPLPIQSIRVVLEQEAKGEHEYGSHDQEDSNCRADVHLCLSVNDKK